MIDSEHPVTRLANFRDLGELTGVHGTIRPGLLYRSDDVSSIDDDEAARVAATGIALIIDLRSANEQHAGRGPLGDYAIDYLSLPMLERSGTGQNLASLLAAGEFTNEMLGTWYFEVMQRSMPLIVEGLEAIANADGPVLFHCAIGKDRTGMFAVALHGALGTPREHIVADYVKTTENLPRVLARLAASQPMWTEQTMVRAGALLRSDAEAMQVLLDAVDAEGTDLEGLLVAGGASVHVLQRLRDWALVTPEATAQHP